VIRLRKKLLLACLIKPVVIYAQTNQEAITSGAQWLSAQKFGWDIWALKAPQEADQKETNFEDYRSTYENDTLEATKTFQLIGFNQQEIDYSLFWHEASSFGSLIKKAIQLQNLNRANRDTKEIEQSFSGYINVDAGVSENIGYPSSILASAYFLSAFSDSGTNYSLKDTAIYLARIQNSDGSWSVGENNASLYLTAHSLSALSSYQDITSVSGSIALARNYLFTQQGLNGSWNSDSSTALVVIALLPTLNDRAVLDSAVVYLLSSQQLDGSWMGDVYTSALALQAINAYESFVPPVDPGLGTIVGRVIDAQSGLPVRSVTVSLSPSGPTALTSGDGSFKISSINPGLYSLNTASAGYQNNSQTVSFNKNTFIDTGAILISRATNVGLA